MSHYDYLDKHWHEFAKAVGGENVNSMGGIVSAHGDKGYSYKWDWEKAGISFNHGMMIFLLTYIKPFSTTVRIQIDDKWIGPGEWVISNYEKFKSYLPEDEVDHDV